MDVSITAKPQTLASSVSLSSQFHLPSSVRREFLGCGTHLRPSGLRSRASKRKLGLRIQSPRCLLHNPPDDNSILVVAAAAVATFATLQLIYMNYRRRRRDAPQFADDQTADARVSSELCKKDEVTLEYEAVGNQLLSVEGLCMQPFERENAFERTYENMDHRKAHDSVVKDAKQLDFQKAVLSWEEVSINGVQPGYELAYSPSRNELLKTNGFTGSNSSSVMINEVKAGEGGDFAAKIPSLLLEKEEDVAVSSCSVISTEKKSGKMNQKNYELGHVATEHSEILTSSNDEHEEVSNCNDEIQPVGRSISHLKSLSTEPCNRTSQDNAVYHSQLKTALAGADVLAEGSPLTAETLIGCLKESPVENELGNAHSFTRDIGRTLVHKNNIGDFSSFPQQNRFARDVNGPTTYLRSYNRLLRDGRLRDCMDLLEMMRKKGLLDMDKVHHTKFLKACKSQKAVKEAFRFCKLIPKATLSTFNMLLSVCANSQDFEGAFQAMLLVKEAGLKPDCKLYTTLVSTCGKSGKVDAMFEVFHEMVNAGVEPNVNTYGALIDGCARAGQVAKAFGAYGIMRSKKVQPDRVIFNALITACGQSGAVDRAFDVLAEMRAEPKPIDPDHVTVGALMKTCTQAGQVDRVREVYKMLHLYNIRGTPYVYTIAVNSCSQTGDLEFALSIYNDMKKNGVVPDEMFLSTLIDVAGHARMVDTAFEILQDARSKGIRLGNISYSSLMGACCNVMVTN
nr:pentatricopeptide repeat protein AaPPR357 [Agave angustifolia]